MSSSSTVEMDVELRKAAGIGNVKFLRRCVADNKPKQYYLTVFPPEDDFWYGNMFHIAAWAEREDFIREVIEGNLLPLELVQQLLCQPVSEAFKDNPLHTAAGRGNVKIVKLFLNAFNTPLMSPPWLMINQDGRTPCHVALDSYGEEIEECGLEILRMDKEKLSNMLDHDGRSLLYIAVKYGMDNLAMEILTSPHPFSASGDDGATALHFVSNCSSSEKRKGIVIKFLLQKKKELIKQKRNDGSSIFHTWAAKGKIWPFKCLRKSEDIIPDVRKVFVELISETDVFGANPLHDLSQYSNDKEGAAQIGKLLIQEYKHYHEVDKAQKSSTFPARELQYPWLVQDDEKKTPLDYAIDKEQEEFAKMILCEDKNVLKICQQDVLFVAIENGLHGVLLNILEIMADEQGLTHLLTNDQKLNVLHVAPICKNKDFLVQLLKQHPDLIDGIDKEGETILHKWVKMNEVWPFEELLKTLETDPKWRSRYVSLMKHCDNKNGNNPLHVAATNTNESTLEIVKLLVKAFQEISPSRIMPSDNEKFSYRTKNKVEDKGVEHLPWCAKNKENEGALHLAINCQQDDQQLALFLLSLHQTKGDQTMTKLLDYYAPMEHKILFLATEKLFCKVINTIFASINKASRRKYLKDSSTGKNVLHLASSTFKNNKIAGGKLVERLVEEESEFINDPDKEGITPLCQATTDASSWIVDVMLQKDPYSAFQSSNEKPALAWVNACEKGHLSVIRTFIKHCPENFSGYCIRQKNSPLHHIILPNSMEYEEFFRIPYIKDLINVQDSQNATPLHKAIKNKNILFVDALLKMDKIRYDIKDENDETAIDLLQKVYKDQPAEWGHIYRGIEPFLATSYFRKETNISEVRNTFSVVAALLATITFTAGFTLPGGLTEDNGEAKLANKAAFSVFIISNTLAMCLSMVVLICLIWSVVFERSKSIYLIDRSVRLLIASVYTTLLAFVSGVYLVISPKSLWAAILIVVMCCLVGISAKRTLLYGVFTHTDKLLSYVKKKCIDPINCMELGLCQCGKNSSNENRTSPREKTT